MRPDPNHDEYDRYNGIIQVPYRVSPYSQGPGYPTGERTYYTNSNAADDATLSNASRLHYVREHELKETAPLGRMKYRKEMKERRNAYAEHKMAYDNSRAALPGSQENFQGYRLHERSGAGWEQHVANMHLANEALSGRLAHISQKYRPDNPNPYAYEMNSELNETHKRVLNGQQFGHLPEYGENY